MTKLALIDLINKVNDCIKVREYAVIVTDNEEYDFMCGYRIEDAIESDILLGKVLKHVLTCMADSVREGKRCLTELFMSDYELVKLITAVGDPAWEAIGVYLRECDVKHCTLVNACKVYLGELLEDCFEYCLDKLPQVREYLDSICECKFKDDVSNTILICEECSKLPCHN